MCPAGDLRFISKWTKNSAALSKDSSNQFFFTRINLAGANFN